MSETPAIKKYRANLLISWMASAFGINVPAPVKPPEY